jgi:hypothetical protein
MHPLSSSVVSSSTVSVAIHIKVLTTRLSVISGGLNQNLIMNVADHGFCICAFNRTVSKVNLDITILIPKVSIIKIVLFCLELAFQRRVSSL